LLIVLVGVVLITATLFKTTSYWSIANIYQLGNYDYEISGLIPSGIIETFKHNDKIKSASYAIYITRLKMSHENKDGETACYIFNNSENESIKYSCFSKALVNKGTLPANPSQLGVNNNFSRFFSVKTDDVIKLTLPNKLEIQANVSSISDFGRSHLNGIILLLQSNQIAQLSKYLSSKAYDDYNYPRKFRGQIYTTVWLKTSLSSHDLEALMQEQGYQKNFIILKDAMICWI